MLYLFVIHIFIFFIFPVESVSPVLTNSTLPSTNNNNNKKSSIRSTRTLKNDSSTKDSPEIHSINEIEGDKLLKSADKTPSGRPKRKSESQTPLSSASSRTRRVTSREGIKNAKSFPCKIDDDNDDDVLEKEVLTLNKRDKNLSPKKSSIKTKDKITNNINKNAKDTSVASLRQFRKDIVDDDFIESNQPLHSTRHSRKIMSRKSDSPSNNVVPSTEELSSSRSRRSQKNKEHGSFITDNDNGCSSEPKARVSSQKRSSNDALPLRDNLQSRTAASKRSLSRDKGDLNVAPSFESPSKRKHLDKSIPHDRGGRSRARGRGAGVCKSRRRSFRSLSRDTNVEVEDLVDGSVDVSTSQVINSELDEMKSLSTDVDKVCENFYIIPFLFFCFFCFLHHTFNLTAFAILFKEAKFFENLKEALKYKSKF